MCLRCQCILILSPGPKRDAPHRCSLLRGWFRLFQVPICKILTYTNQSWFQFIAKKCIFRKEQQREELSANVQTGHESSGAGTARPSGELCGAATRWTPMGTSQRRPVSSSHRRWLCWQKPTQTKGERLTNQQVALHQGRRTRRRVVTKHQPGTTLRFARQCACSRWPKYGQHSSMLDKYNKIHAPLQAI